VIAQTSEAEQRGNTRDFRHGRIYPAIHVFLLAAPKNLPAAPKNADARAKAGHHDVD
jgi:hypothetical protein